MAAPSITNPGTPTPGYTLRDGFKTVVALSLRPNIALKEVTVKLPGRDGGEPIEQTTMRNVAWRTMAPRSLKTITPFTINFAFDPDFYGDIDGIINDDDGSITVWHSDNTAIAVWAYLQKVEFEDQKEGTRPTGTASVCPTNWDKANKVEAGPAYQYAAGT